MSGDCTHVLVELTARGRTILGSIPGVSGRFPRR